MNTAATTTPSTPEDLLTMPDGKRYELVDGNLVERKKGARSSYIAGEIYGLLHAFCRAQRLG